MDSNTTEHDFDKLLAFASALAKEAGVIMRQYFHDADQHSSLKQDATVVTIADTNINDLVITRVGQEYPNHGVLGEEASVRTESPLLWVCDPIDGTNGFTTGEPTAVFSLAFVVDGVTNMAVTYDPFQDRLYSAIKGRGALCNGNPIHVSSRSISQRPVIAIPGNFKEIARLVGLYTPLAQAGYRVRAFGGIVFKGNIVAEGKVDGIVWPAATAHDIAAIKLLVEEAGGRVTNIDGEEQRYDRPLRGAIISNGLIHDDLVGSVRDFGVENYLQLDGYKSV